MNFKIHTGEWGQKYKDRLGSYLNNTSRGNSGLDKAGLSKSSEKCLGFLAFF